MAVIIISLATNVSDSLYLRYILDFFMFIQSWSMELAPWHVILLINSFSPQIYEILVRNASAQVAI